MPHGAPGALQLCWPAASRAMRRLRWSLRARLAGRLAVAVVAALLPAPAAALTPAGTHAPLFTAPVPEAGAHPQAGGGARQLPAPPAAGVASATGPALTPWVPGGPWAVGAPWGSAASGASAGAHYGPGAGPVLTRRAPGRIVGGEDAQIKDFPYQVAWLFNNALHCGAALIHPEWLLTAAHCFPSGNLTDGSAFRAGSPVAVAGGQLVSAAAFFPHPVWPTRGLDLDVGLVHLEQPLRLDEAVQPVRIVDAQYRLQDTDQLTITGWGLTQEKAESYSYGGSVVLQKVNINPVDHQHCSEAYRRVNLPITEHMLCAQGPHRDTCKGDSGGPLTVLSDADSQPRLLGVVSWGIGCAQDSFPGVYTDLRNANVRQFIEVVTGYRL